MIKMAKKMVHSPIHAVVIYINNKSTKKVVKYVQS